MPALMRLGSIAFLALALVGAQVVGLMHRVEHAQLSAEAFHDHDRHGRSHDSDPYSHDHHPDQHSPEHNCAAYDAATLSDGPPHAIAQSQSNRPVHAVPTRRGFAVADNSPHLPFHSRAPPRA